MSTASPPRPTESETGVLYRMTVGTYHEMIRLGLVTRADRVVLLDGLMVKTMSKGPRHASTTRRAFELLRSRLPAGWFAIKEDPITLANGPDGDSEPEPDVAVVAGSPGDFDERHPTPGEIVLVVEVADSSLPGDRRALRRYAWAGLPTAWIVNLGDDTIEVYTEPTRSGPAPGYSRREVKRPGDTIEVVVGGAARATLGVSEILGPAQG